MDQSETPFTIHWSLFLRVSSPKNRDVVLRRLAKAMRRPVTHVGSERYWKDETLFSVYATTPLETSSIAQAIFEVLRMGPCVGGGWHVHGLSHSQDRGWTFKVTAGVNSTYRISIPGVHVMFGDVSNDTDTGEPE